MSVHPMSSIFKKLNSYNILPRIYLHFLLSYQILKALKEPHTFLSHLRFLLSVFLHHPVGITLMEPPTVPSSCSAPALSAPSPQFTLKFTLKHHSLTFLKMSGLGFSPPPKGAHPF